MNKRTTVATTVTATKTFSGAIKQDSEPSQCKSQIHDMIKSIGYTRNQ